MNRHEIMQEINTVGGTKEWTSNKMPDNQHANNQKWTSNKMSDNQKEKT